MLAGAKNEVGKGIFLLFLYYAGWEYSRKSNINFSKTKLAINMKMKNLNFKIERNIGMISFFPSIYFVKLGYQERAIFIGFLSFYFCVTWDLT